MRGADSSRTAFNVIRRIIICGLILTVGVAVMLVLTGMKKPPAEAEYQERVLRVAVTEVQPRNVDVVMTGYGTVQPIQVVNLAPEVSGRVAAIHARLEVGAVIPAGEVLFTIDTHDYAVAVDEAQAQLGQLENVALRLEKQLLLDRERLKTLARNRDLAHAEYARVRHLFEQNQVGAQSGVEAAEKAFNAMQDGYDQLAQAVALYPLHIAETRNSIEMARARLRMAENNLARCRVAAAFDARVVHYAVQEGQFVNRGASVLTLADDSRLEIHVPLDSRDARQWLRFSRSPVTPSTAWFTALEPVPCTIHWTEDDSGHNWQGTLHRVVQFSEETRTITVAVRLDADQARPLAQHSLPLVAGMFCRIDIPGRTMRMVMPLPRWAVSFENTVYRVRDSRLQTAPVEVARIEGETAFVASGLRPGDQIIRTRLVDPLENSLLEISLE